VIEIVNKHHHEPTRHDVYIGRGSPLGNQWTHMKGQTKAKYTCANREESIALYRVWLAEKIAKKDCTVCDELNKIFRMAARGTVYLVCYCVPLSCHGEVIKELIQNKLTTHPRRIE